MFLKATTLDLIKNTQAGNIYSNPEKEIYLLKPTDRAFDGKVKKPIYYISKIINQKSNYITGLFSTNNPTIFSGDERDTFGVKKVFLFELSEAGKTLKIYPRGVCHASS